MAEPEINISSATILIFFKPCWLCVWMSVYVYVCTCVCVYCPVFQKTTKNLGAFLYYSAAEVLIQFPFTNITEDLPWAGRSTLGTNDELHRICSQVAVGREHADS